MRKLLFLFSVLALTGCDLLYPSMMLRTPRNYPYTPLSDSVSDVNYKISPNDFINLRLYSQDGFRLIDFTNLTEGNTNNNNTLYLNSGIEYLVESDGTVKLPVIGRIPIAGLTIRDATQMLEQRYSQFYIKPYILLKVTNRRVIVFPGSPGSAKVIPLINDNTTLIEALALSGGITEEGKAKQIKLIRGNPDKPQVYLIDLSTIDGIKAGSTILQEGDIIYVTPQRRPSAQLLQRIAPTLSLLTSLLLAIALIKSVKL